MTTEQTHTEAEHTTASVGECPKCHHSMEEDAYPDIFSGYCRNCGYRARIGGDVVPGAAPANDQAWRRAHGFPD